MKSDQIKSTMNFDWSRQIIDDLTVDDLDKEAILKAKRTIQKKNEDKEIAKKWIIWMILHF